MSEKAFGKQIYLDACSFPARKGKDNRDSLRMDLRELESEVENSLKKRAASKLSQRHSLDANLAAGSGRVFIMKAVDEEEDEGNFPMKYLQESSGPNTGSANNMSDAIQDAHWEEKLSDLAWMESILKKRKAELQEVDAVLTERRRQLAEVVQKRKLAEGRLKRAEEDAGIIEQRAAETSAELIRAGNQLISLEIKEKALNDRQEYVNKSLHGKSRNLKEVEDACEVVRQNVDKLNQELKSKMDELDDKKKQLKEVESRIQLSLRVEELQHLVTYTENEVKKQEDKYLRALKEGEKALEEKTCQLARTRSEIQTQMTEFHGLNGKINRLRTEMKELQFNFRKEQEEAYRSSQRRQEEIRKHDVRLKEAEEKLKEINKARNESMDALKSHREEFALLRRKIHESSSKIKESEELRQQKEAKYGEMISMMDERKSEFENELSRLKSETQGAEESLGKIMDELTRVTTELETARDELLASKATKDSLVGEVQSLQQDLEEKKAELSKLNLETEDAFKELEAAKEKFTEIQAIHDDLKAEMKHEHEKAGESGVDCSPQKSSTPKKEENGDESIVNKLQETVKLLTADNEEKQNALVDARAEVKELKEFMESERKKAHQYLMQMASESEGYRKHIENLEMEHANEKHRFSMKKDLLLNNAQEHRWKARKLSEELSNLKENHLLTKQQLDQLRDTLAKDVKEVKEHIEGLSSQMRAEFARSLRQVEHSKEQTSEEIENLREKEDEMEIQLTAIQQSINEAKKITMIAAEEKAKASRREKEEALLKEKRIKLLQQQTHLRAQIRKQMSTRADSLQEERKKAEQSLAGLKKKLSNLEEVITRKDTSVDLFRLKLLQSKVMAEKNADSNSQIEELKRRLRELEDEKELIQSQRNHLVTLKEAVSLDGIRPDCDNLRVLNDNELIETRSSRLGLSLDSLMNNSVHTKSLKPDLEVPCRDHEQETELNTCTSFPDLCYNKAADAHLFTESKPVEQTVSELPKPTSSETLTRIEKNSSEAEDVSREIAMRNDSNEKRSLDAVDAALKSSTGPYFLQKAMFPSKTLQTKLPTDARGKSAVVSDSTNQEESQIDKTLTLSGLMSDTHELSLVTSAGRRLVDKGNDARVVGGSTSSFADDRKSEVVSIVRSSP
ncbi:PREDICTED: golgin subfamily A member 1-like isoform X3 [Acropora digitifera]|uniref:golgin subfamily A member 1-like isoform X3 n=1 Tax=Acropora digitifera TaxID=70779 RepID=UPI00077ABDE4|nr:PREDICTED: golgin subfamily A member 1-like isoform X3 [Acropora digitifera]